MCFCRYCCSKYEPIYHINHSKQPCGLLQQVYHILDMGMQPLRSSMGFLSPLLICKFLNNCEIHCRYTAHWQRVFNPLFYEEPPPYCLPPPFLNCIHLSLTRVFQIVLRDGWGEWEILWGNLFSGWLESEEECIWPFEPFPKLKTLFCKY